MRPDFQGLRAVLFDLDGTLVETHIDFPAMTRAMERLAWEARVSASVIEGWDILGMVEAAANAITARGDNGTEFRKTAFAELEAMEVEGCSRPLLLPGSDLLLEHLTRQGVKVGIVTRNCRAVSASLLIRFGLRHNLLLTRDDVPLTKPNPEHLWDALRLLGEPPDAAAMVGDHPMDVQAGRDAGCAVTLGVRGQHKSDYFASCPPTIIVQDLAEALPLFAI